MRKNIYYLKITPISHKKSSKTPQKTKEGKENPIPQNLFSTTVYRAENLEILQLEKKYAFNRVSFRVHKQDIFGVTTNQKKSLPYINVFFGRRTKNRISLFIILQNMPDCLSAER